MSIKICIGDNFSTIINLMLEDVFKELKYNIVVDPDLSIKIGNIDGINTNNYSMVKSIISSAHRDLEDATVTVNDSFLIDSNGIITVKVNLSDVIFYFGETLQLIKNHGINITNFIENEYVFIKIGSILNYNSSNSEYLVNNIGLKSFHIGFFVC